MRKSVEECRTEAMRACQWTSQEPDRRGESLLARFPDEGQGNTHQEGKTQPQTKTNSIIQQKQESMTRTGTTKGANIKKSEKGSRTTKIVGFSIDTDLLPELDKLSNRSRVINELLRNYFKKP